MNDTRTSAFHSIFTRSRSQTQAHQHENPLPPLPPIDTHTHHTGPPSNNTRQSTRRRGGMHAPSSNTLHQNQNGYTTGGGNGDGGTVLSNMLRRRRSNGDMLPPAPPNPTHAPQLPSSTSAPAPSSSNPIRPNPPGTTNSANPGDPIKIRLVPFLESSRTLRFEPISRSLLASDGPLRIGRFTDRVSGNGNNNNALERRLAFKSKVVSRGHAEVWVEDGKLMIKDTKSSSGTFLNHQRLAPPGQESKPFGLKDGDILQLGVDFQGGQEDVYKCVKIRVEIGREWQKGANAFNSEAMKTLRALSSQVEAQNSAASGGKKTKSKNVKSDCCICLFSLQICQSIFIAPCSHSFHYKCIRPLIESHYPGFTCPLCRIYSDLSEDVEVEEADAWEEEEVEGEEEEEGGTNVVLPTAATGGKGKEKSEFGEKVAVAVPNALPPSTTVINPGPAGGQQNPIAVDSEGEGTLSPANRLAMANFANSLYSDSVRNAVNSSSLAPTPRAGTPSNANAGHANGRMEANTADESDAEMYSAQSRENSVRGHPGANGIGPNGDRTFAMPVTSERGSMESSAMLIDEEAEADALLNGAGSMDLQFGSVPNARGILVNRAALERRNQSHQSNQNPASAADTNGQPRATHSRNPSAMTRNADPNITVAGDETYFNAEAEDADADEVGSQGVVIPDGVNLDDDEEGEEGRSSGSFEDLGADRDRRPAARSQPNLPSSGSSSRLALNQNQSQAQISPSRQPWYPRMSTGRARPIKSSARPSNANASANDTEAANEPKRRSTARRLSVTLGLGRSSSDPNGTGYVQSDAEVGYSGSLTRTTSGTGSGTTNGSGNVTTDTGGGFFGIGSLLGRRRGNSVNNGTCAPVAAGGPGGEDDDEVIGVVGEKRKR